jgi:hypothetical protein
MKQDNTYIYCEVNKLYLEYTYDRITELMKLIKRG